MVLKTLLANGLSTFFIKGNPVFSNGPKTLPKILPDCPNLWHWVFDNFILDDKPSEKALQSLAILTTYAENYFDR